MTTRSSFLARLAIVFCTVVMFFGFVASPSFAGGFFSKDKAETTTPNILKQAENITQSEPMSMKELQSRTKDGLNEVQGKADADKMINKSTPGQPDSAIARKVNEALDKNSK